ncbi:MAG: hypothetical protein J6386_10710 [Candidatus Synoicihabitans palmerolidicus]|nr:hypothetical protein [Candidatus Synoicihabitans palmerolidicus]
MSLTIWCNEKATKRLEHELAERGHRLVWASQSSASVLDAGGEDESLNAADVALGQPDADQCRRLEGLRWLEVTTAGYARYDTPEFKETLRDRGGVFTNMSGVFSEPCAQHWLAMMLALSRCLPDSWRDQQQVDPGWDYYPQRAASKLCPALGGAVEAVWNEDLCIAAPDLQ